MYKIVGADNKEYGPVTADQVRQWIAEGRANSQTIVRFEEGPWKPLSTFPEFASNLTNLPPRPISAGVPPPPTFSPALQPKNNGMAIAGLVCGILAFVCCGPVAGTLGIIFSIIGLVQISQNPAMYTGKSLAWTGLALSLFSFVLFGIFLLTGAFAQMIQQFPGFPKF